jgi:iron complex outermembrane receptor protein
VTATFTEALRSGVPNAVSVISKSDIRLSGETSVLSVVNKRVPGVFVTERGVLGYGAGPGAAGGITIRGTGGSPNTQVLVLTDGRPQYMGLFGHPLPDTYVTSGVERVEVIRGPASLLHGTNAMGGVMNIIYDHRPGPGPFADAGVSYGTFETQKYELRAGYGFDNGAVSIAGNYYDTDGHRPFSSFRVANGAFRFGTALSGSLSLSGDLALSKFKTYDPGPASRPYVDHWVNILRGSSGIALENRFAGLQGALKLYYNFGDHEIYDGFRSTDDNVGALLYQAFRPLADNITTAGVDFRRYGGVASNIASGADFGRHYVQEYSAYLLTQQQLLEMYTASAGVRLNRNSITGAEVVPQFGLAARLGETTLKANVGKGFRSPTIRELYLFPAPTPTLTAERLWSYEAGVMHRFSERVHGEVSGYIADGRNLIRTTGAFPNLVLSNSGAFTHRGIEISANVAPAQSLTLDATYGYLDPDEQTTANPRHKLFVGASYGVSIVTVSASVQHVSRLFGADFNQRRLPDYTLVNVRVSAPVAGGMSAYVAAENLFDTEYQIVYDYPMPGRTLFAGLRWGLE